MKKLVIFGSGGHASVLLEIAELLGKQVVGVVSKNESQTHWKGRIPFISLQDALSVGKGIIAVGDNLIRRKIVEEITSSDSSFLFETLIHPSAVVSPSVSISHGVAIMAGVKLNPGVVIGSHSVINTGAIIDHDSVLEDFSFVGPGACLGGNVKIGYSSMVGIGAVLKNGQILGSNSLLGAGSLLVSDLPDNVLAYGHPAKEVRRRERNENFLM